MLFKKKLQIESENSQQNYQARQYYLVLCPITHALPPQILYPFMHGHTVVKFVSLKANIIYSYCTVF